MASKVLFGASIGSICPEPETVVVSANITQYSEVSKAETKGQETGASWAVSSNRKNQPSDIYLWGTPSVTSH